MGSKPREVGRVSTSKNIAVNYRSGSGTGPRNLFARAKRLYNSGYREDYQLGLNFLDGRQLRATPVLTNG